MSAIGEPAGRHEDQFRDPLAATRGPGRAHTWSRATSTN